MLWLVGSAPLRLAMLLEPSGGLAQRLALDATCCRVVAIGRHAYLHLIDVSLPEPLPQDTVIHYDLIAALDGGAQANIARRTCVRRRAVGRPHRPGRRAACHAHAHAVR